MGSTVDADGERAVHADGGTLRKPVLVAPRPQLTLKSEAPVIEWGRNTVSTPVASAPVCRIARGQVRRVVNILSGCEAVGVAPRIRFQDVLRIAQMKSAIDYAARLALRDGSRLARTFGTDFTKMVGVDSNAMLVAGLGVALLLGSFAINADRISAVNGGENVMAVAEYRRARSLRGFSGADELNRALPASPRCRRRINDRSTP